MIQQPTGPLTGLAPANFKMLSDGVQMSSLAGRRTYILFLSSFVEGDEERMWCPVRHEKPEGWSRRRTDPLSLLLPGLRQRHAIREGGVRG